MDRKAYHDKRKAMLDAGTVKMTPDVLDGAAMYADMNEGKFWFSLFDRDEIAALLEESGYDEIFLSLRVLKPDFWKSRIVLHRSWDEQVRGADAVKLGDIPILRTLFSLGSEHIHALDTRSADLVVQTTAHPANTCILIVRNEDSTLLRKCNLVPKLSGTLLTSFTFNGTKEALFDLLRRHGMFVKLL
jgi:hypothetical protein